MVSALGALPSGRGGVVGRAAGPGVSSRSVRAGDGASNSSVYGDADLDVDMGRRMRAWTDAQQRCSRE